MILSAVALPVLVCACGGNASDGGNADGTGGQDGKTVVEAYPVAASGHDIYEGSTYEYGPSVIINSDGSIDAWFATSGGQFGDFFETFDADGSKEPLSIGTGNSAAQRFVSENPFYSVAVCCPSWSGQDASLTLSIYKWDTDYSTTVKSAALNTKRYEHYSDNGWLSVTTVSTASGKKELFPKGEYLWVLSDGTTENSGVWKYSDTAAGVQCVSYWNGSKVGGQFESRVMLEYSSGATYWDQICYRHSADGGSTWTAPVNTLKPTEGSRDAFSVCDPGVVKFGGYYYLGYTSTENEGGVDNHLYMCRSKSPDGPWEKWNGSGWGGNPQPVVQFDGVLSKWGAGEPSMVVVDGTLYLYYSWNDAGTTTRLSTAPADDVNWPAHLTSHGTVIDKSGISGADHCDVKYRDDIKKFYAIHTAERMTSSSYIVIWQSSDGIKFSKVGRMKGSFQAGLHNCGMSGDELGHMDISKQQYVAYAYGVDSWAKWKTRWSPLTFKQQ